MRYALELAYDGRSFRGWQKQPGQKTVQGELETALSLLEGSAVNSVGAGRTDSGVHARGQVASCDLLKRWQPDRLLKALNNNTPSEIEVIRVSRVPEDFNARYDATLREYVYFLWTKPYCYPQVTPFVWKVQGDWRRPEVLKACKALEGEHDFGLFCPQSERPANTVRKVFRVRLVHRGHWAAFRISASSFLFHMVRYIVGDLNRIADGRLSLDSFMVRLSGRSEARTQEMAPASGLFLWRIGYSPSPWE